MEAPPKVRRAIILLWAALAIGFVEVVPLIATDSEFGAFEATFVGLAFAVNACAIYFAARRRNWARIVILVFVAISVSVFVMPDLLANDPWWSIVVAVIATLLEVIAVYWLFTGEGRHWYAKHGAEGAF